MGKNDEEFLGGDIHVHVQVQLLRVFLHASVLVLTGQQLSVQMYNHHYNHYGSDTTRRQCENRCSNLLLTKKMPCSY
jgi:hypothetical protein